MDIAVLLRAVPDPVEELEIDGNDLDRDYLGYVLNEFDDHALEEGILLKEDTGGTLTVLAAGTSEEVPQMLFTALAKGADAAVQLGDDLGVLDSHTQARMFADALRGRSADVVLCGVQASDELDGQVAMLVAAELGLPHFSVVVAAVPEGDGLKVTKEYWGGITADFAASAPVVLGIQAARQAPRYVAVSRIRQAQEAGGIAAEDVAVPEAASGITVTAMRVPETGDGAEIIEGDGEEAAQKMVEIIRAVGV